MNNNEQLHWCKGCGVRDVLCYGKFQKFRSLETQFNKKFGIISWSNKRTVKKRHCLQQLPQNCNDEKNSDDRNALYSYKGCFQAPRTPSDKAEEQEIQGLQGIQSIYVYLKSLLGHMGVTYKAQVLLKLSTWLITCNYRLYVITITGNQQSRSRAAQHCCDTSLCDPSRLTGNSLKGCNLLPALLDDSEEMQKDAESLTNTAPHDRFTITRCVKAAGHRIVRPSCFCVCVFIWSHETVSFPHIMATSTVSGRDICLLT